MLGVATAGEGSAGWTRGGGEVGRRARAERREDECGKSAKKRHIRKISLVEDVNVVSRSN